MSSELGFSNHRLFLENLDRYKKNPLSTSSDWYAFFEGMTYGMRAGGRKYDSTRIESYFLVEYYKKYGHLISKHRHRRKGLFEFVKLSEILKFKEEDFGLQYPSLGVSGKEQITLKELLDRLEHIFAGKVGYEFSDTGNMQMESYLYREIVNQKKFKDFESLLKELFKANYLEQFLQKKFIGEKRFSVEGGEVFLPMVRQIVRLSAENGYDTNILGMAHRGRINILANLCKQPYSDIFASFDKNKTEGKYGDVKYHKGFNSLLKFGENSTRIVVAPNASHLESVNSIVLGMAKARQLKGERVKSIIVHGDAAVAGQGVVYESLQLSKLKGFSTGGTIHIVINNLLGFTAEEEETRSTLYCTDIAKTFGIPVFHVDSNYPESCMQSIELAFQTSHKFNTDVFVDLQCYRLWGHNEGDEPRFTNPLYYKEKKSNPYLSYLQELFDKKLIDQSFVEKMENDFKVELNSAFEEYTKNRLDNSTKQISRSVKRVVTSLDADKCKELSTKIFFVPDKFNLHKKLRTLFKKREKVFLPGGKVDWASAEAMAFASLLEAGIHVRISGQDSCRGTFSQRHAVLVDQETEERHSPLQHISDQQAPFTVYNSALSEYSAMAFELGYSMEYQKSLVIWEAQFGDFTNGAQIIVDEYLVSGYHKWGNISPLVLFLPHGHEGMGPDHSSCRLERFLQLAADNNCRIVYPSYSSQLFHILREQALLQAKTPLILATPKSMLRLSTTYSDVKEFTNGRFEPILEDVVNKKDVSRVICCCGKIYFGLAKLRGNLKVALIRIEQIYPLDIEKLKSLILQYSCKELFWVQEECENQGAWPYIKVILSDMNFVYVGRQSSASQDSGNYYDYAKEQERILKDSMKSVI